MKKIILVDFFDTVMFRRIHSSQIPQQWAKGMLTRYPILYNKYNEENICKLLNQARGDLRKSYKEPPYKKVIELFYDNLGGFDKLNVPKDEFIQLSYELNVAVELGCQYPNKRMVNRLRKAKEKGSSIYIVSDFYLPESSYNDFLIKAGIKDLFDGIFVSETYNATKADGSLYDLVLDRLQAKSEDVMMIGDSRHSDKEISLQKGIKGIWYFPFRHKVWTNISKRLNLDYSKRMASKEAQWLYGNSNYGEYGLMLYQFCCKLLMRSNEDRADKLAFLSRGGHFLKSAYDTFMHLLGIQGAESYYCYNSRKVCFKARDEKPINSEQYRLMRDYMGGFLSTDGRLYLVDEGWYNHSQMAMCEAFGYGITGYYIGCMGGIDASLADKCSNKGLLFDNKGAFGVSRYYGVFRTNCSMYEQILAANHGSVTAYRRNQEGEIEPVLKENTLETEIYNMYIKDLQAQMLLIIKGLTAWNMGECLSEKFLAKMILRTSIFANRERCRFMNSLDSHRFDNCSDGKAKTDKSIKDVNINIAELICNPGSYLGMFCKLQRKLVGQSFFMLIYYPFAYCYYWYVRLCERI